MTMPRYSLLNSSRITRMARSGSWWRRTAGLDLGLVEDDVVAVEDTVLGGSDVDEGGFHARQYVLDLPQIDVAVDGAGRVGGAGHVVLDQAAALQDGHLDGHPGAGVHDHE